MESALLSSDTLLAIAAFAASVAALVPIFVDPNGIRKKAILVLTITLVAALTFTIWLRRVQFGREVTRTQDEIQHRLARHSWTIEELYGSLYYPNRDVFFEALFNAVNRRLVGYRIDKLQAADGSFVPVRLYYIESERDTSQQLQN